MNIIKKIKEERPWSSNSKYFVWFHWTLFAVLWVGFLQTLEASTNQENITYHGHMIDDTEFRHNEIPDVLDYTLLDTSQEPEQEPEAKEPEGTNVYLWTSNIIGADRMGDNLIRVKFNTGLSYDVTLVNCWNIKFATGYVFGKNWQAEALFDQLEPGLEVLTFSDGKIVSSPGCVVKQVVPVAIQADE